MDAIEILRFQGLLDFKLKNKFKMVGISWIIVGILIVLALFVAKLRHIKHKTFIFIILILLAFFYISASKIISDQNINLGTFDGVMTASNLYLSWLVHIGGNLGNLAGNAIKMDWVGNESLKK